MDVLCDKFIFYNYYFLKISLRPLTYGSNREPYCYQGLGMKTGCLFRERLRYRLRYRSNQRLNPKIIGSVDNSTMQVKKPKNKLKCIAFETA